MTPAARYAAAIDVLDVIQSGKTAEQCLKDWSRGHRFAGSKDRAAIRDHVFDVLRAKRSLAALGGGDTGRALVLGLLRRDGVPFADVFGAGGYAPEPITEAEAHVLDRAQDMSDATKHDMPNWLWPVWQESLGSEARAAAFALQSRAPVFLRVNRQRCDVETAQARLAEDDISTDQHEAVPTALRVTANERRIKVSAAYDEGLVELQDAASQEAMLKLTIKRENRVLDYCAGGGGKALALADMHHAKVVAHDVAVQRMVDLPRRAARAKVHIETKTRDALSKEEPFDLVLCDAPCSGSGTWRRTPEAKWNLTAENLNSFNKLQLDVLQSGAGFVASGGQLAYATCSVLSDENDGVVSKFISQNPGWRVVDRFARVPDDLGDGFFMVVLQSD